MQDSGGPFLRRRPVRSCARVVSFLWAAHALMLGGELLEASFVFRLKLAQATWPRSGGSPAFSCAVPTRKAQLDAPWKVDSHNPVEKVTPWNPESSPLNPKASAPSSAFVVGPLRVEAPLVVRLQFAQTAWRKRANGQFLQGSS